MTEHQRRLLTQIYRWIFTANPLWIGELAELPDRERIGRMRELRDQGTDVFVEGMEFAALTADLAGEIMVEFPTLPVAALLQHARDFEEAALALASQCPDVDKLGVSYRAARQVIDAARAALRAAAAAGGVSAGKATTKRKRGDSTTLCIGLWWAAINEKREPPSAAELARIVGCDPGTASRAIKSLEDDRRERARHQARDRYEERGGPKSLRTK